MPWKGSLKTPSGYTKPPKNQGIAPHISAKIEWVHGYKGNKARNNIKYLIDGSIAYHAAALGIIYDPKTHTQRHFTHHTDEVTAIAFSDDKRTVATGEIGMRPKIIVWDGISMQVIQTF
jgi:microtubule-associated protein-like 6